MNGRERTVKNTTPTRELTGQSEKQKAIPSVAELDMRDYFAAKAMPLAWKIFDEGYSPDALTTENIAEAAYQIADAMLAARGQQQ